MASLQLGILASHNGTLLQAIIDACAEGRLDAGCRVVICNNSGARAMRRARAAGIPTLHLSGQTHPSPQELDAAIRDALEQHGVNLVVLAGYLKRMGPATLERFKGRVLSMHPSLLPKFGGRGMYGDRVHAAVLAAGDRETGVTIHHVVHEYDAGAVVAQARVPALANDTVESLRERVRTREGAFYVETLQAIAEGRISLAA